jgi:hypothetical protein
LTTDGLDLLEEVSEWTTSVDTVVVTRFDVRIRLEGDSRGRERCNERGR